MTILPFPLWPLAEHIEFGQNTFDGSIGSGVLFCISTSCQRPLIFSTPPPLHRLVGFYLVCITQKGMLFPFLHVFSMSYFTRISALGHALCCTFSSGSLSNLSTACPI